MTSIKPILLKIEFEETNADAVAALISRYTGLLWYQPYTLYTRVQLSHNSDVSLLQPCQEVRGDLVLMNSFKDDKEKIVSFAVSESGQSNSVRRGASQISKEDGDQQSVTVKNMRARIRSGAYYTPRISTFCLK